VVDANAARDDVHSRIWDAYSHAFGVK
jgi:hypothetical protein